MTNNNELYHYGVKGMKWGVSRAKANLVAAKQRRRAANKEYDRAFNKATTLWGAWGPNSKQNTQRMMETAKAANAADQSYKKAKQQYKQAKLDARAKERGQAKAQRALAKMEKQKYKDAVNSRAKEIQKGASLAGRLYNSITGAHKYQAQMEIDMDRRAQVNKAWRD